MADVDTETVFDDGKTEPLSGQGAAPVLSATSVVVANDGSLSRVHIMIDKSPAEELRNIGNHVLAQMSTSVNGAKSAPKIKQQTPAPLPEKTLTGITKNVLTPFTAVTVDGFDMDKVVGYDWLYMRAAAAREGVTLRLNSAFRTPAEQQRLINERMNPDGSLTEAGKRLGRAGPINGNNVGGHLMGQALDIGTGMTVAQLRAALTRGTPEEAAIRAKHTTGAKKPAVPYTAEALEAKVVADLLVLAMADPTRFNQANLSAQYKWLTQRAASFGFRRTVPTEPWHWAHTTPSIVTTNRDIGTVDTLLAAASTAGGSASVLRTDKAEPTLAFDRAMYDVSRSFERSAQMARTTRAQLFVAEGLHAVYQGATLTNTAARYEVRLAEAGIPAPTYEPDSLDAASFDYTTGLWGGAGGSKV